MQTRTRACTQTHVLSVCAPQKGHKSLHSDPVNLPKYARFNTREHARLATCDWTARLRAFLTPACFAITQRNTPLDVTQITYASVAAGYARAEPVRLFRTNKTDDKCVSRKKNSAVFFVLFAITAADSSLNSIPLKRDQLQQCNGGIGN